MKKLIITTLLVVILASTVLLSACASYTEPTTAIRWTEESYTYIVSMQPTTIPDAIEFDDNEFVSVTELVNYSLVDMITPDSVDGTYTTTLELVDGDWLYTTVLAVEETYDISSTYYYGEFVRTFLDGLTAEQYGSLVVDKTDDTVTLCSTTISTVLFEDSYTQDPIQSTKNTVGYYIGEAHNETTTIDITCDYADDTATVSGTINGSEVSSSTTLTSGTIDVAQLMLYSRSLDQTSAFETSATVTVFDPTTTSSATASMDLTQNYCLSLDIEEEGDYDYASVNCVNITLDYTYVAFRLFNNPSDTMSSAASSTGLNMNTAVMFQSGIYVFQFDSYYSLYSDLAYVAS